MYNPNDIYFLADLESSNGTAVAVVSCAPGYDPFIPLMEWYRNQGFRDWDTTPRKKYKVIHKDEYAASKDFVYVLEWYNGVISTGHPKRKARYTDLGGEF